ncbi:hypothetical protein RRG08_056470 [Elysia crispata]|uniref:MULE transposase domain-containing protein n=1 Tax=Elysia crispata TaxID=231223 RepID=A0AAE1CL78_9GAST|nr:hypothetical protein RRG08_056470 [Elysia crispata]
MEKYTTSTGHTGIILQGYRFRIDRAGKSVSSWRCVKSSCKARCQTDFDISTVLKQTNEHNHEPESEAFIARHEARQACKRKATELMNEKPSKIACAEALSSHHLDYNAVKQFREAVYKACLKIRPPLPKNIQETFQALNQHNTFSKHVWKNDAENNIVMLTSEECLNFLSSVTDIYADGTFKYCARYFYQLYTIHGLQDGMYVPCVYFLLPAKTTDTYRVMFQYLVDACPALLSSSINLHLDLEIAAHRAAKSIFPSCTIIACHFHVSQAWYRKIQPLNLTKEYKDSSSSIGSWLKLFFGLPALPPSAVGDCLADILFPRIPDDPRAPLFSDYIVSTYIDEFSEFPPAIWASDNIKGRTTNACESFHFNFSKYLNCPHPNIFVFIEAVDEEMKKSTLKIRAVRNRSCGKTKVAEAIKQKEACVRDFKMGTITMEQFIHVIGKKMLPTVLERITKVHPVVLVDGRTLSDQEVRSLLERVAYKFSNFIKFPLYTGQVEVQFSFFTEKEEFSDSWIAAPLIAGVLLLVLVVAVLVRLAKRYRSMCPYIYRVNRAKRRASINSAFHDNETFEYQMEEQEEKGKAVDGGDKTSAKSLTNPLYDNGVCRDAVTINDIKAPSGGYDTSSCCSDDIQPDGQPSNTEGGNTLAHRNIQQAEVTVHLGWAGNVAAHSALDCVDSTMTLRPPCSKTTKALPTGHQDTRTNETLKEAVSEETDDGDMTGINTHKYETVDCSGFALNERDRCSEHDSEDLNKSGVTNKAMDTVGLRQEIQNLKESSNVELRTKAKMNECDIGNQEMSQNLVVRQTVIQMEPIIKQVLRQEKRSVEIRQQMKRPAETKQEVAKIRTKTPCLSKFDRQRHAAEEDQYDRFKNLRYIDEPGANDQVRCRSN